MEHDVDLARLRREYAAEGLAEDDAGTDPWALFRRWLSEALASGMHEPNAMVVATVSASGRPSARTVLLKGFDETGFRFFTNRASRKGRDLAEHPGCALLFGWHPVERQVRVEGTATPLPEDEVEAYFRLRPRGAQIGAWASLQSEEVSSRRHLDQAYEAYEREFEGRDVPVPPTWGGYRVHPELFEFWQGRAGRLHDRIEFLRTDDGEGWARHRLAP